MKVVVKDANILIDFANGSLFDPWFQLGYETWTTDLVLAQVQREDQWKEVNPYVQSGDLIEHETDDMLEQIWAEPSQNRLGPEDTSALLLARDLDAILLTGDRQLRKQGEKQEVEVHGLLWALENFVEEEILKPKVAAEKLELVIEQGALLPPKESQRMITKWKRGGF